MLFVITVLFEVEFVVFTTTVIFEEVPFYVWFVVVLVACNYALTTVNKSREAITTVNVFNLLSLIDIILFIY